MIKGIILIIGLQYALGWAFQEDLKEMEKENPKLRQYIKQKYDI